MCQQSVRILPSLHRTTSLIFVVLAVLAISACTKRSTPNPEIVSVPESPLTTPKSLPGSPIGLSPVPTPDVIKSQATAVVSAQLTITQATSLKPEAGMALVVGRLIDAATEMPASYAWVYLADVIGPDQNPRVMLDISVAPLSITNEDGVFYFQNVRPGKYGIVIWSTVGSTLVTEPNSDYSLLFSLQAGEVKNLRNLTAYIP
jgi:hypothetical protein